MTIKAGISRNPLIKAQAFRNRRQAPQEKVLDFGADSRMLEKLNDDVLAI